MSTTTFVNIPVTTYLIAEEPKRFFSLKAGGGEQADYIACAYLNYAFKKK
jgi:hypothetical protein